MFSNLKVRTGLMLAQLAVALAALVAIGLGWNSMRSSADTINALDSLSVQQSNLIKDAYTQMLRATIRADIAAAQRAAGDTNGAADNSRTVQQLIADANKKMEAFKAVPKVTALGKTAEGELLSSFNGFSGALQAMMAALDKGDAATYLTLKNTQAGAASAAFFKQLSAFASNINAFSEERVQASRTQASTMTFVYLALAALILAVSLGAFLFMNRVVLRPLRSVSDSFDKIAGGDLTVRVEATSSNEIGQLMAAVKRMQESLTRTVAAVRRGVREGRSVSHGERTGRALFRSPRLRSARSSARNVASRSGLLGNAGSQATDGVRGTLARMSQEVRAIHLLRRVL